MVASPKFLGFFLWVSEVTFTNQSHMYHMQTHTHAHRNIPTHLQQSAVVGEAVLPIPAGVFHLVPLAGQQQLIGTVEGGGVDGVAIDQANQVLPVMLPGQQYTTVLAWSHSTAWQPPPNTDYKTLNRWCRMSFGGSTCHRKTISFFLFRSSRHFLYQFWSSYDRFSKTDEEFNLPQLQKVPGFCLNQVYIIGGLYF